MVSILKVIEKSRSVFKNLLLSWEIVVDIALTQLIAHWYWATLEKILFQVPLCLHGNYLHVPATIAFKVSFLLAPPYVYFYEPVRRSWLVMNVIH